MTTTENLCLGNLFGMNKGEERYLQNTKDFFSGMTEKKHSHHDLLCFVLFCYYANRSLYDTKHPFIKLGPKPNIHSVEHILFLVYVS